MISAHYLPLPSLEGTLWMQENQISERWALVLLSIQHLIVKHAFEYLNLGNIFTFGFVYEKYCLILAGESKRKLIITHLSAAMINQQKYDQLPPLLTCSRWPGLEPHSKSIFHHHFFPFMLSPWHVQAFHAFFTHKSQSDCVLKRHN